MTNTVDAFQSFGKEQMEASVASAAAVTKGFQAIAAECADYSRKSFEHSAQTFEKVIGADSLEKAFAVQQSYARACYEAYLGQMNKLGELYVATAQEAYRPFENRVPLFKGPTTQG